MASVIGCALTLRARWRELSAEQRESFLALIEQETGRLSTLVGDILDTSRIEAGTFTYVFGDVDVGDLVRETASMVSLGTDEVTVTASVVEPLPVVRGDRDRLRQLLINLLSNAAKYTVSGDEIEVRAAAADKGAVLVSVEDHGPGIPPDQQRLVFEKFGCVNSGGRRVGALHCPVDRRGVRWHPRRPLRLRERRHVHDSAADRLVVLELGVDGDVPGLGGHPVEPGSDGRVRVELEAALGGYVRVRVEGDVGER